MRKFFALRGRVTEPIFFFVLMFPIGVEAGSVQRVSGNWKYDWSSFKVGVMDGREVGQFGLDMAPSSGLTSGLSARAKLS